VKVQLGCKYYVSNLVGLGFLLMLTHFFEPIICLRWKRVTVPRGKRHGGGGPTWHLVRVVGSMRKI
jgi:hypothetical protein